MWVNGKDGWYMAKWLWSDSLAEEWRAKGYQVISYDPTKPSKKRKA